MIRQCSECKVVYGEKDPLEDKTITHGYCDRCFNEFMGKAQSIKGGSLHHGCPHCHVTITSPGSSLGSQVISGSKGVC